MSRGIIFALTACLIWGLLFVVPLFMGNYSAFEIAFARYLVYGALSMIILFKSRLRGSCNYPSKIWVKALYFAGISSIGYYTWVVLALRYSSPAVCALILGISPITIAFYGNWKEKEYNFKTLLLPCSLIFLGLILINAPKIIQGVSHTYLLGLLSSFIALLVWSWFVVANARFLKDHPEVASSDWSTLLGVSTLFWASIIILLSAFIFRNELPWERYATWNSDLANFLIGSAILGLVCSWLGAYLWNKASLQLPVSLAGQLTVFETIFGLCFVYALQQELPPITEIIGIVVLLTSITFGLRSTLERNKRD